MEPRDPARLAIAPIEIWTFQETAPFSSSYALEKPSSSFESLSQENPLSGECNYAAEDSVWEGLAVSAWKEEGVEGDEGLRFPG